MFKRWKSASKMGNTRVSHAGYSFGSKLEAALFDILKLRERAGEIKDIKPQTHVKLTLADIKYIPDFSFIDIATGELNFAEAKGYETPEWKLKARLWECYGPGRLEIWKGTWQKPRLVETLIPVGECTLCTKKILR